MPHTNDMDKNTRTGTEEETTLNIKQIYHALVSSDTGITLSCTSGVADTIKRQLSNRRHKEQVALGEFADQKRISYTVYYPRGKAGNELRGDDVIVQMEIELTDPKGVIVLVSPIRVLDKEDI